MQKRLRAGMVILLVMVLIASFAGYGSAGAKASQPQDQVKNFMNAAAGLKAAKAAGCWVTEEGSNVTSKLNGVATGTKISLSKLKLQVTGQTTDTAQVTATYNIVIKIKGKTVLNKSNEQALFTLNNVNNNS